MGLAQLISSLIWYYTDAAIAENKGGPIWSIKELPLTPVCANLFPAKICLLNHGGCAKGRVRQQFQWDAEEYS